MRTRWSQQIRARIGGGVPPSRIIVGGASKGAVIAALVSTRLKEPKVRYVLLANCNDWLIRTHDPRLTGEVLSIYEASDEIGGSCAPLAARSPDLQPVRGGAARYRDRPRHRLPPDR